jgi:hypothetical protein
MLGCAPVIELPSKEPFRTPDYLDADWHQRLAEFRGASNGISALQEGVE